MRQWVAREALQRVIAIDDDAVPVKNDGIGGCLGELAHALFALAHPALGLPMVGDVVDQHKHAHLRGRVVEMRDQVDLDHALRAAGHGLCPHVLHLLAAHRAVHVRLDGGPSCIANGLVDGHAQNRLRGLTVVARVALVGKAAHQAAYLVIGDQCRYRISDQAQQRRLCGDGLRAGLVECKRDI